MEKPVQLRVLTLNCAGIPFISPDRKERISAIATELAKGTYDLVALQEIWSYSDYKMIARSVFSSLHYSYYFRSGCTGSGVCIFSKGKIVDVLFQTWLLNGYPHRIHHADWFGGKGVGLARIFYQGILINFYSAHLHAMYNSKNDQYLSHRVCQAFEFSQFISNTTSNCDVVIVSGDFNAEPKDIPYQLLCHNANLFDAFEQCETADGGNGATSETKQNTYTKASSLKKNPNGKRIDYIMYNYHNGSEVEVLSCDLPLDKIPELCLSFSDHEAVSATLNITKSSTVAKMEMNNIDRIRTLEETGRIIAGDFLRLRNDRILYSVVFIVLLFVVLGTLHINLSLGLQVSLGILHIVLTIVMLFCLIMATVWNTIEVNSLKSVNSSVEVLISLLRNENEIVYSGGSGDSIQQFVLETEK